LLSSGKRADAHARCLRDQIKKSEPRKNRASGTTNRNATGILARATARPS
jgi:hypothetical protein